MTLPKGWSKVTFADIASQRSGNGQLIKGKLATAPGQGLFPAFSASGQDVWRDGYEYEGDAIVVSAVGARCGKAFRASGKWSAVANTHVVQAEPDVVDTDFLFLILNDEDFWEKGGTAQPFVKVRATFEREVALPPLGEQRRIVAKLGALTARLARARAELDRVPALAERWRERALAKAFRSGRERSGEIDIAALCVSITDGDHQAPPKTSNGVPFITISAMNSGRIDLAKATRFVPQSYFAGLKDARRPRVGDVLYSVTGSIGIPALVRENPRFVFQRHIAILRPKPAQCDPEWLAYILAAPQVRDQARAVATGTAQLTIPLNGLRRFVVPLLPISDQRQQAKVLSSAFTRAARLEAEAARARALLDRLEAAVVAKAFRGELVPQDPNDEPASVLLDRLRVQRAAAPAPKRGRRKKEAVVA